MNPENKTFEVIPQDYEDLWRLSLLVERGDLVCCQTRRVLKMAEEKVRVPLKVCIEVEKVALKESYLRVLGRIVHVPQKYAYLKGFREGVSIKYGMPLTVVKAKWEERIENSLKKSVKEKRSIFVVCLDFKSCCIARISDGVKIIWEGSRSSPKESGRTREFFRDISSKIHDLKEVVVMGPHIPVSSFLKFIKEEGVPVKVVGVVKTSYGGLEGLYEGIRHGKLCEVAKNVRFLESSRAIEELLASLFKGDKRVVYGLQELKKADELGAVEEVYVLESLLTSPEVSRLLESVEKKGGRVVLVADFGEVASKLRALGGAVGRLRYPIYRE